MKTVMILGAAAGQIPFIKICKEKGHRVIAVSPEGDYPGFDIADDVVYADTSDKETILKYAMEFKIDAILTDQTDVAVPSVAYVSEKMGLRSIGYHKAMIFSDKYSMRVEAERCGIHVPVFYKANSEDEAIGIIESMELPVVVKPTRNSGSRGVRKISTKTEIVEAVRDAFNESRISEIIIEKYINGKEYLVDGFALEGKYINTDVGEKLYFDLKGKYVSKMCMFSSAKSELDDIERKVLETNRNLVERIGLPFGITHAEYIYSYDDNEVYLVEIAARGGGVFLSSDLTPKASGINTNEYLIDYVVDGKSIDVSKLELKKGVAAWRCFTFVPGRINSIDGQKETSEIPGVFKVCLEDLYIGKRIVEIKDDKGKYGPILIEGDSKEDCKKTMSEVERTLKITTEQNGIVSEMVW